jgi:hypothetical protein
MTIITDTEDMLMLCLNKDGTITRHFLRSEYPRDVDYIVTLSLGYLSQHVADDLLKIIRYDCEKEQAVEDMTDALAKAWLEIRDEDHELYCLEIDDCPPFIRARGEMFAKAVLAADIPEDGDDGEADHIRDMADEKADQAYEAQRESMWEAAE